LSVSPDAIQTQSDLLSVLNRVLSFFTVREAPLPVLDRRPSFRAGPTRGNALCSSYAVVIDAWGVLTSVLIGVALRNSLGTIPSDHALAYTLLLFVSISTFLTPSLVDRCFFFSHGPFLFDCGMSFFTFWRIGALCPSVWLPCAFAWTCLEEKTYNFSFVYVFPASSQVKYPFPRFVRHHLLAPFSDPQLQIHQRSLTKFPPPPKYQADTVPSPFRFLDLSEQLFGLPPPAATIFRYSLPSLLCHYRLGRVGMRFSETEN